MLLATVLAGILTLLRVTGTCRHADRSRAPRARCGTARLVIVSAGLSPDVTAVGSQCRFRRYAAHHDDAQFRSRSRSSNPCSAAWSEMVPESTVVVEMLQMQRREPLDPPIVEDLLDSDLVSSWPAARAHTASPRPPVADRADVGSPARRPRPAVLSIIRASCYPAVNDDPLAATVEANECAGVTRRWNTKRCGCVVEGGSRCSERTQILMRD